MNKIYLLIATAIAIPIATAYAANPKVSKVFDYVPAPGQFINTLPAWEEGDDAAAMSEKVLQSLNEGEIVCLGAYGGYLTVGFDHTIANVAGVRDFYIGGNAFVGNSEPGVVMVAYDINGNGLPDDKWFEIAGSEYGSSIHNYEITYKRPADANADIEWIDSQGKSGFVYKNKWHSQPYWPEWLVGEDKLVFRGTCLPENGKREDSGTFVRSQFDFGYADNAPNLDGNQYNQAAMIDIDWAIDENGNQVKMPGVDFVRIYTGINSYDNDVWVTGECSTEVAGVIDQHVDAVVDSAVLKDFIAKYGSGSVDMISNDDVRVYVDNSGMVRFSLDGNATVKIFDYSGRCLLAGEYEEGDNSIDISSYPHGMYFVVINDVATKILK